jgi:hypothetical protein
MNAETRRQIDRGEWWDGDVEEWLGVAIEQWDAADQTGEWNIHFDVADLARILRELKARRDAEDIQA